MGLSVGVGEAAAAAVVDGVAETGELAGTLEDVGDDPAVVDVNAWRKDRLIAYVDASSFEGLRNVVYCGRVEKCEWIVKSTPANIDLVGGFCAGLAERC